MIARTPPGYVRLAQPGVSVVARSEHADALLQITARGAIYDWAAAHPERRELHGRRPVFVVPLPYGGPRVVVRRNTHGGWLARLRGDRFFAFSVRPEVRIALALASVNIPTPEVIAHATYRINPFERRVDVVTRELPPGLDLGAALTTDAPDDRRAARWRATTTLLAQLAGYGIWHRDLNVKNVYLIEEGDAEPRAALLDVDRVRFHPPGALVARANAARLVRSLFKWRQLYGARVSDTEIAQISNAATGGTAQAGDHRT